MANHADDEIVGEHKAKICQFEEFMKVSKNNTFIIACTIVVQIIGFAYMWGALCNTVNGVKELVDKHNEFLLDTVKPHIVKGELYMNKLDKTGNGI